VVSDAARGAGSVDPSRSRGLSSFAWVDPCVVVRTLPHGWRGSSLCGRRRTGGVGPRCADDIVRPAWAFVVWTTSYVRRGSWLRGRHRTAGVGPRCVDDVVRAAWVLVTRTTSHVRCGAGWASAYLGAAGCPEEALSSNTTRTIFRDRRARARRTRSRPPPALRHPSSRSRTVRSAGPRAGPTPALKGSLSSRVNSTTVTARALAWSNGAPAPRRGPHRSWKVRCLRA
jgi:hypothetical protein